MSDEPKVDPLGPPCPRCKADPGEPCLKPNGDDAAKPHAARVTAAEAQAAKARQEAKEVPTRIEGARWRRLYRASRMELEQRGDWTALAAEQLESLVLNLEEAAACRAEVKKARTVKGSTGQPVPNPLGSAAGRCDAVALSLAKALKLTPDTRGTSAPAGDVPVGDDDDEPEGAGVQDDFADLDEVARARQRRNAKAG